jgi:hypothetical protein
MSKRIWKAAVNATVVALAVLGLSAQAATPAGQLRENIQVERLSFTNVAAYATNDTQAFLVDVTEDLDLAIAFSCVESNVGNGTVSFKLARAVETNVYETTPSQTITFSIGGNVAGAPITLVTNLTVHATGGTAQTSVGNAVPFLRVTGPLNGSSNTLYNPTLTVTRLPKLRR